MPRRSGQPRQLGQGLLDVLRADGGVFGACCCGGGQGADLVHGSSDAVSGLMQECHSLWIERTGAHADLIPPEHHVFSALLFGEGHGAQTEAQA